MFIIKIGLIAIIAVIVTATTLKTKRDLENKDE